MKDILKEISYHYFKSNQDDRKMSTYYAMKEHAGWQIHRELLYLLRGKLAEELLSDRFTELGKDEKDAKQRAYAYCDELIRFLLNPLDRALKRVKFSQKFDVAMKQGATGRKQPEGKE